MCVNPKKIKDKTGKYKYILVPCQSCEECKAERKSSELVRAYYESEYCRIQKGIVVFTTLTYDEESQPVLPWNEEINKCRVREGLTKIYKEDREKIIKAINKRTGSKQTKLTCWDIEDIRTWNDDIRAAGQYGSFTYHGKNEYGKEYEEKIITGKFVHKYMVACERGSNRTYTDKYGNTREAQEKPHYHSIDWFYPLEGQDFTDQYINFFKLIAEKWKKGIIYDELTDRDIAKATEYIVSYIQKEQEDEKYYIFRHAIEENKIEVKIWNRYRPFNTHSTNLGEYLLENLGVNKLIEEHKYEEAIKVLNNGAPMPRSKEKNGELYYYAKIPRYYIKKLVTKVVKYSYGNPPEFESALKLLDNRDYVTDKTAAFTKINKPKVDEVKNEITREKEIKAVPRSREKVDRTATDYTLFGEAWKLYTEQQTAINRVSEYKRYIDGSKSMWRKYFDDLDLNTWVDIVREKDKIVNYDYNGMPLNEYIMEEYVPEIYLQAIEEIEKEWWKWRKQQKETKIWIQKQKYKKRAKEAQEKKQELWKPRATWRTYKGIPI